MVSFLWLLYVRVVHRCDHGMLWKGYSSIHDCGCFMLGLFMVVIMVCYRKVIHGSGFGTLWIVMVMERLWVAMVLVCHEWECL